MKNIFTICLLFPAFMALAQAPAVDRVDTTYLLDELVVTANKIPELKTKISQQVLVIPAVQIQNLNAQNTADLIANSGIVGMQKSQQGGGSPQLRGFEASRVLLVIDGVRMNNLIYRAGHLQNVITLDNNILERAEILLGPSSTVYGSDALGGVIHFRTKDVVLSGEGPIRPSANAFIRFGSVNDEKTGHVDVNVGGKRFGSLTSFTYGDFGDLRMGEKTNPSYGKPFGLRNQYVVRAEDNSADVLVDNNDPYTQKFSGYSQFDILQKFRFQQSNRVDHVVNLQYSTSSNIPRYDRLTDPDGSGLRQAEWYYGPQERVMGSYQLKINDLGQIADGLVATLSYQDVQESRHDRRFNRANRRNLVESVDVVALTLDFNKARGKSAFRYGFDSQLNSLKSTGYNLNVSTGERTPVATRYPNGENTMNTFALYYTHTYDATPEFTVTDGLRAGMSRLHSVFEDKTFFPFPFNEVTQKNEYLSGQLGAIYHPATWRIAANLSTGFRVPNVDDLARVFETSAGASLIVPNPDLKPEKTYNLDLTIGKEFSDVLRWENTFFYTLFKDAIVVDEFEFNGQSVIDYDGQPTQVMANQNKREASIRGFSSVLHATFTKALSADASYNYTYGRITSGVTDTPLDHIPPAFGRVSVQYAGEQIFAQLFSNFNGWKKIEDYFLNAEDNEVYATEKGMPSWYTINVRGGYKFSKYLQIQAGIDNLMDLQYRTFSSGINSPGRNFFITLRGSI